MSHRKELRPLIFTIFAPVFWSTGGLGLRLADVSAWEVLFWRSLFMTLFLFAWDLISRKKAVFVHYRHTLGQGIWVALFISLSLIFYVFSISNTTVADSLLIQGTAPILILLLAWLVLGEKLKMITMAGAAAITLGIVIIMIPSLERGGLSGNVFGLVKAFAFASGTIAIRKRRSVALLPAVTTAAAFTMLVSAFFVPDFQVELKTLLILAYLGCFQTGIAFLLYSTWSGKLNPSVTGLIVILEAVLGPIWVWIFLHEQPARTTFLGGAIIIVTLVLHTLLYYRGGVSVQRGQNSAQ